MRDPAASQRDISDATMTPRHEARRAWESELSPRDGERSDWSHFLTSPKLVVDAGLAAQLYTAVPTVKAALNGLPMCWRTVTSRRGSTITYALVLLEGEAEHSLLKVRTSPSVQNAHLVRTSLSEQAKRRGLATRPSGMRQEADDYEVTRYRRFEAWWDNPGKITRWHDDAIASFLGWELNKQKQHAREAQAAMAPLPAAPESNPQPVETTSASKETAPSTWARVKHGRRTRSGSHRISSPDSITATLTVNGLDTQTMTTSTRSKRLGNIPLP